MVVLFGCLLLSVSIMVFPFMPQDAPCQVLAWSLHFSFIYIMAPITGKTWRLYMIFYVGKKKLHSFNITTWRLSIYFLIIPSLGVLGYLIAWTIKEKDWTQWEVESNGENREYCYLNNMFLTISLACVGVLLLYLVRLAYGVKDVPRNFNESFWLGASIYTLSLILLFIIPISIIPSIPPEVKQVLGGIACLAALEAVLGFLFWRKFYMIWFHQEEIKKHHKDNEESDISTTDSSHMAAGNVSNGTGSYNNDTYTASRN